MQRTEGVPCFRAASKEVLPDHARQSVKWLGSDAPQSLSIAKLSDVYPCLDGIIEDGARMVFRAEDYSGGARTAMFRQLLAMQLKFRCPQAGNVYAGRGLAHGPEGAWSERERDEGFLSQDWSSYSRRPYSSHQEWIDDLIQISLHFPERMDTPKKKGVTLLQTSKNRSTYKHYGYLQNCTVFMAMLTPDLHALVGWVTTGNEAYHSQMNNTLRTVTHQHEDRAEVKLDAMALLSLLAHNSATYHPTTAQWTKQMITRVLVGELRKGFFPDQESVQPSVTSQSIMRSGGSCEDKQTKVKARKIVKQNHEKAWKKHLKIDKEKREKRGRPPVKKRERVGMHRTVPKAQETHLIYQSKQGGDRMQFEICFAISFSNAGQMFSIVCIVIGDPFLWLCIGQWFSYPYWRAIL